MHQLKQYQQNRFHKSKTAMDPDGNPEEHYTTSTGVLFLPYLDPQIVDCFQDSYLATANGSHKPRKLAVYSSKLRGLRNRKPSEVYEDNSHDLLLISRFHLNVSGEIQWTILSYTPAGSCEVLSQVRNNVTTNY